MSLVAYGSSSEDESDNELSSTTVNKSFFHINTSQEKKLPLLSTAIDFKSLKLPFPKSADDNDTIQSLFEKLPEPKKMLEVFEEEDDEFLFKRAIPSEMPALKVLAPTKNLVRITIPSLKDFEDVEETRKNTAVNNKPLGLASLINILPPPKSGKNFVRTKQSSNLTPGKPITFIPDTVKNKRPAFNTEIFDSKIITKTSTNSITSMLSGSESSDSDCADFFSLNYTEKLPDVSSNEIEIMVSKKTEEMAKRSTPFLDITTPNEAQLEIGHEAEASVTKPQQSLEKKAIQALIGSQAKRLKVSDIKVIEIAGDQMQINKDEWLRTALASATTYQPTGVLNDEEPFAGTRRKHQITYLAHKAKANEAELQAMWSANRQNRRQTQNKYGF